MSEGNIVDGKAKPLGAYPHFKTAGDLVFVSGTSSRRPDNSIAGVDVVDGKKVYDIKTQTRAVFENISDYLSAAGSSLSEVVDVTTFLVDMEDFAGYNEVYGEFFDKSSGPARTTVAVHQLPNPELRIEVKAMALRKK